MMRNPNRTIRWIVLAGIFIFLVAFGACKQAEKAPPPTKPGPAPSTSLANAPEPVAPGSAPTQGVTDTEIKIGIWSPQTGPASSWGAVARGMKAYFDWINEQGGIHGRKLNLLIRDDGYMPPRTVGVVKELTEKEKVFAFVGGIGTATGMAVKNYLDQKQIINIGMASGADTWNNPVSRFRFAVYPMYVTEANLLVKYSVQTLNKKKIAMFYQNDGFGKEGLKGAEAGCAKFGGEMVTKMSYELTDTDLSTQALKIKSSGAEAVILWATAKHSATFVKEAAKIGYKPQYLATSTLSDPIMFKLAGEAWNGLIIANWMPMVTGDEESIKHYKEAMSKFAPDERIGNFTLAGFILAEPFVEGLGRVGKNLTTDSLISVLESIQNFNGDFVHNLTFSKEDHQGLDSIYFIKASGGKLEKISGWMK